MACAGRGARVVATDAPWVMDLLRLNAGSFFFKKRLVEGRGARVVATDAPWYMDLLRLYAVLFTYFLTKIVCMYMCVCMYMGVCVCVLVCVCVCECVCCSGYVYIWRISLTCA